MKLIIGLGSGRCGTRSLARLLSLQPDCEAIHELRPLLPWAFQLAAVQEHAWYLRRVDKPLAASVAFFYLNYVPWLAAHCQPVKFVCLKRDKEATVNSFLRLTEETPPRRNHWMNHDGRRWRRTDWDPCFPKYEAASKRAAVQRYYDDYYRKAARLSRALASFRIFPTAALDSEAGVRGILEFIGAENAAIHPGVWLNRWATK